MDEIKLMICEHCGNVFAKRVEKVEGGEYNQGGWECPVCKGLNHEYNTEKEFVIKD